MILLAKTWGTNVSIAAMRGRKSPDTPNRPEQALSRLAKIEVTHSLLLADTAKAHPRLLTLPPVIL
jgi:hypothetical protein